MSTDPPVTTIRSVDQGSDQGSCTAATGRLWRDPSRTPETTLETGATDEFEQHSPSAADGP
jgi:hypothetical protein